MSSKAKSLKEAGNDAFRRGRYDDAVLLYTEACQLDPSEYTYPLNRCMTYLKLGKLREAERDASKSLQLQPAGNPKALFRRGLARKGLGKIDLAREDFVSALTEEPANPAIRAELDSLPSPSREDSAKSQEGNASASKEPVTAAVERPLVNPQAVNRQKALKAAIKPEQNGKAQDGFLSEVSTRRLNEDKALKPSSISNPGEAPEVSVSDSVVEKPSPQTSSTSIGKDFRSLKIAREQRLAPSTPQLAKGDTMPSQSQASPRKLQVDSGLSNLPQSTLPQTTAPKSMYEFETRWMNEKTVVARASMIIALSKHCKSLPEFIGSSLTPELLDDILTCLDAALRNHPEVRAHCIDFIHALPNCARFDFVSMLCANTALIKNVVAADPRATDIMTAWGLA